MPKKESKKNKKFKKVKKAKLATKTKSTLKGLDKKVQFLDQMKNQK